MVVAAVSREMPTWHNEELKIGAKFTDFLRKRRISRERPRESHKRPSRARTRASSVPAMTLSAVSPAATLRRAPAGASFARRDGLPVAPRASLPFTNGRNVPKASSRRLVPTMRATASPSMPTPAPAQSRDFTLDILCKDAPGVLQVRSPASSGRRRRAHLYLFFERPPSKAKSSKASGSAEIFSPVGFRLTPARRAPRSRRKYPRRSPPPGSTSARSPRLRAPSTRRWVTSPSPSRTRCSRAPLLGAPRRIRKKKMRK